MLRITRWPGCSEATACCIITASRGIVPEWFPTRSAEPSAGMRSIPIVFTLK